MPLILTFGFDSASFARLEQSRQRHFPPDRNFIPVHLTLFQQLPEEHLPRLLADLARFARSVSPLDFAAVGILDFSRGAAIEIECPAARELQSQLRTAWRDILTPSDDWGRKLHVTVQNKADTDSARATQASLRASFHRWSGVIDRLLLWHYRGGPWERAGTFPLSGATT